MGWAEATKAAVPATIGAAMGGPNSWPSPLPGRTAAGDPSLLAMPPVPSPFAGGPGTDTPPGAATTASPLLENEARLPLLLTAATTSTFG